MILLLLLLFVILIWFGSHEVWGSLCSNKQINYWHPCNFVIRLILIYQIERQSNEATTMKTKKNSKKFNQSPLIIYICWIVINCLLTLYLIRKINFQSTFNYQQIIATNRRATYQNSFLRSQFKNLSFGAKKRKTSFWARRRRT